MKKVLSLLFISLLFIASCGPSVDSEQKAWDANQKIIAEVKTQYPAFIKAIDVTVEVAEKAWEKAKSISDEEKKAEQMEKANNLIEKGTVGQIHNLKSEISKLENLRTKLLGKKMPTLLFEDRAREVSADAKLAIDNAELVFQKGNGAEMSVPDVLNLLANANSGLKESTKKIDKIIDEIEDIESKAAAEKKKLESAKDSTSATTNTGTTTDTKTETTPKFIKCEYCGKDNAYEATECKSCGAAISHK